MTTVKIECGNQIQPFTENSAPKAPKFTVKRDSII